MAKMKSKRNGSNKGLKQALTNLKREVRSTPKIISVNGNPKAINIGYSVYVNRTIAITKKAASSSANISVSDVLTALGGSPTDVRIDKVKVWNTTIGGSITCSFGMSSMTNVPGISPLVGQDYGTSNSLAGTGVDIPDSLTQDVSALVPSLNLVSTQTSGATDTVLAHVMVRFMV